MLPVERFLVCDISSRLDSRLPNPVAAVFEEEGKKRRMVALM
jgi:hypothetical protein